MKKKSLNKAAESRGRESRGFFVHKRNFAQEIKKRKFAQNISIYIGTIRIYRIVRKYRVVENI